METKIVRVSPTKEINEAAKAAFSPENYGRLENESPKLPFIERRGSIEIPVRDGANVDKDGVILNEDVKKALREIAELSEPSKSWFDKLVGKDDKGKGPKEQNEPEIGE